MNRPASCSWPTAHRPRWTRCRSICVSCAAGVRRRRSSSRKCGTTTRRSADARRLTTLTLAQGEALRRAARRRDAGRRRHAQLEAVHQRRARRAARGRRDAGDRDPACAAVFHVERRQVLQRRVGRPARRHGARPGRIVSRASAARRRHSPNASTARAAGADTEIVFTAHSLPQRVVDAGDPYVDEVARHRRRPSRRAPDWRAFTSPIRARAARRSRGSAPTSATSSASGRPQASANSSSRRLGSSAITPRSSSTSTCRRAPPHKACGASLRRTESLNSSPTFIAMLEDLVRSQM